MEEPQDGGMPLAATVDHVFHLLAVGQKRRAREMAADQVARWPDDPTAHLVLSQVLLSLGERLPAQAAADEAVRLAPDDDRGHGQRARVLFLRGCFAEAEKAVQEALALDPQEPEYHILRARLLSSCGRRAAALAAVEEALVLDPEDSDAHQLRAWLLLRTRPGQWRISEATARRALELDPEDANAHAILGAVLLRTRRLDPAEECFRAALTLDPSNGLALRGLAEALMARSLIYRPFLTFSLFLETAGVGAQLAVIAGLWAIVNAAGPILRAGRPPLPSLAQPLEVAYVAFCAYTWFVRPVTRFLLARRYPWLKGLDV